MISCLEIIPAGRNTKLNTIVGDCGKDHLVAVLGNRAVGPVVNKLHF